MRFFSIVLINIVIFKQFFINISPFYCAKQYIIKKSRNFKEKIKKTLAKSVKI